MDRLTYKSNKTDMVWFVDRENDDIRLEPCEMSSHHNRLAIDKLAAYEDSEEQSLLLKLPCKVGDTVYAIGFNNNRPIVYEAIVLSILITVIEIYFNVKVDEFEINSQLKNSMFGKTVFLTQEQAEEALKKMRETEE